MTCAPGFGSFFKSVKRIGLSARAAPRSNESLEEAYQRRLRESQRVEERVEVIYNEAEFKQELDKASSL